MTLRIASNFDLSTSRNLKIQYSPSTKSLTLQLSLAIKYSLNVLRHSRKPGWHLVRSDSDEYREKQKGIPVHSSYTLLNGHSDIAVVFSSDSFKRSSCHGGKMALLFAVVAFRFRENRTALSWKCTRVILYITFMADLTNNKLTDFPFSPFLDFIQIFYKNTCNLNYFFKYSLRNK